MSASVAWPSDECPSRPLAVPGVDNDQASAGINSSAVIRFTVRLSATGERNWRRDQSTEELVDQLPSENPNRISDL
jgi:hypothetical protein